MVTATTTRPATAYTEGVFEDIAYGLRQKATKLTISQTRCWQVERRNKGLLIPHNMAKTTSATPSSRLLQLLIHLIRAGGGSY